MHLIEKIRFTRDVIFFITKNTEVERIFADENSRQWKIDQEVNLKKKIMNELYMCGFKMASMARFT